MAKRCSSLLWTELFPPKIHVQALTHNVIVFADGVFGRQLGSDEGRGWGPHDGISALIKADTRELALSFFLPGM